MFYTLSLPFVLLSLFVVVVVAVVVVVVAVVALLLLGVFWQVSRARRFSKSLY